MIIHEIHNLMKELVPGWATQHERFKYQVERYAKRDDTLLDIGCGRSTFMHGVYSRVQKVIGIDPDAQALAENPVVQIKLPGGLEKLNEIESTSVDIAVTSWVLEHIKDPDELFIQLNKVIKPGGVFISLTPNKKSFVVKISRLIPNFLHPFLVHKMWGRAEEDTYPTYYVLNTAEEIGKYSAKYGYSVESFELMKDPTYYAFRPRFLPLVLKIYDKIIKQDSYEGILFVLRKND